MDIFKELQEEGVDAALLEEIQRFRQTHPAPREAAERVPQPRYLYYGREIWESAAAALLCGEHLLLAGPKATGKNVLAENLAAVFSRPVWDVSMYVNVDAAALIGADTLRGGQVEFREGPVSKCARLGGVGVLDEVNMAKNEALAVLHATLDHRRVIDVPGYERIHLDEATGPSRNSTCPPRRGTPSAFPPSMPWSAQDAACSMGCGVCCKRAENC